MLDVIVASVVIGFLFGYFSDRFSWSERIATWLDKFFKR